MSSLHRDHLLAEGSEPTVGSRPTLAPARGTTRRSTGSTEEKAPKNVPTPRRGKARTTTTENTPPGKASTAARRTRSTAGRTAATVSAATAKAARTAGAKGATAAKATVKAATSRAAAAKPATVKAPAAKASTAKAATAKASIAKPVTAKAATAKAPAAKAATTRAATAKRAPAEPAVATSTPKVAAEPTGEVTPRTQRPTPFKRPPEVADPQPLALAAAVDAAELTEAAEAQAREVVVEAAPSAVLAPAEEPTGSDAAAGRLVRLVRRRPPARRRPVLYLAVALVGALGVGLTTGEPPAQANTQTVSSSVSVAEQLGLDTDAQPIQEITSEVATERLGELAASRTERDAEQAQAAQAQVEADRIAAEAAAEAARPKAVLPVQGARLTSGFGPRWGSMHSGIDLAAPMMTPEYAVMDGVVLEAGPASGYGNAVYIQHESGDVTVYGHMEQILVSAGQVVQAGDTIALLGNRGQSTGPHLHFEVHVGGLNGQKIDPLPWLRERGVAI